MKKQRIIDSEHASLLKHNEIMEKKNKKMGKNTNNKPVNKNAKPKWQKQSEEFRAIMKANVTTTGPQGFGKGGCK